MALWTPATSGAPSLALWFDANDAASITHSSGAVSQWNDKSGNANHASQATSGLKPTYDATAASNKGAIVFGAGSTQKLLDLTSTLSTGTAWTVFSVAKMTAQSAQAYVLGGSGVGLFMGGNLPSDFGEFDGANIRLKTYASAPTIYNAAHVLEFSPSTLWADGVAVSSYESGSGTLTNSFNLTRIGSRPDQSFLFFIGEQYELIFVPSTLTTGNRELYEGYLAWKWGLEGLLDAGHTYKSAAPTDGVGGSVSAALAVTDRPDATAVNVLLAVQAALGGHGPARRCGGHCQRLDAGSAGHHGPPGRCGDHGRHGAAAVGLVCDHRPARRGGDQRPGGPACGAGHHGSAGHGRSSGQLLDHADGGPGHDGSAGRCRRYGVTQRLRAAGNHRGAGHGGGLCHLRCAADGGACRDGSPGRHGG
jgi:hypothetical protein